MKINIFAIIISILGALFRFSTGLFFTESGHSEDDFSMCPIQRFGDRSSAFILC